MEYTISQLAELAGISTRTLRYYEEIGLLIPRYKTDSGYRMYSSQQVELLHIILIYRYMGMPLSEIKNIVYSQDDEKIRILEIHLDRLNSEKSHLERVIESVKASIASVKGEHTMTDNEKFKVFRQSTVEENEKKYGSEIREKYGNDAVDAANRKMLGMTCQQYQNAERLNRELNTVLKTAVESGNPAGEEAQNACRLHREWIKMYWDSYTEQAHLGLCHMYTLDDRFRQYYEKIAPGCADFLYEAMKIYLA